MSYLGLEMCGQDTGPKDMCGQFAGPVVNFLVPAMLECNAKYKHVVQVIYLELKLGPSVLRVWKQQYFGHASILQKKKEGFMPSTLYFWSCIHEKFCYICEISSYAEE